MVEQCQKQGLAVILNIHHFDEEINEAPLKHIDRFLAIWKQISEHYSSAPDSVYFELLNEPHGTLGTTSAWSDMAGQAIGVIRKMNPDRTIILGPGDWNSINQLDNLVLPADDRNLIITFHYYSPMQFTHQGADWVDGSAVWMGTTWDGNTTQKNAVLQDFDTALKWSQRQARPVFLGEFGAFSQADMPSRQRWTSFVAREAEKRGFSWAYWEFCSGFGAYDLAKAQWNEPILQALIPPQ